MKSDATRPYRMTARRAAVQATRDSICAAAVELWLEMPYDEITLDEVARRADVTRQTVLRHFGSKEGLVLAATDWYGPQLETASRVAPGDLDGAVTAIIRQYESMGDANVRMLEAEDRIEALRHGLEQGRTQHRAWVAEVFAPWLDEVEEEERALLVDALYAATDVMIWKLLRRDFGRSREDTEAVVRRLVTGVVHARAHEGERA